MFNDLAQRFEPGLVTHAARAASLFSPASIAIHDDGDMSGYGVLRSH